MLGTNEDDGSVDVRVTESKYLHTQLLCDKNDKHVNSEDRSKRIEGEHKKQSAAVSVSPVKSNCKPIKSKSSHELFSGGDTNQQQQQDKQQQRGVSLNHYSCHSQPPSGLSWHGDLAAISGSPERSRDDNLALSSRRRTTDNSVFDKGNSKRGQRMHRKFTGSGSKHDSGRNPHQHHSNKHSVHQSFKSQATNCTYEKMRSLESEANGRYLNFEPPKSQCSKPKKQSTNQHSMSSLEEERVRLPSTETFEKLPMSTSRASSRGRRRPSSRGICDGTRSTSSSRGSHHYKGASSGSRGRSNSASRSRYSTRTASSEREYRSQSRSKNHRTQPSNKLRSRPKSRRRERIDIDSKASSISSRRSYQQINHHEKEKVPRRPRSRSQPKASKSSSYNEPDDNIKRPTSPETRRRKNQSKASQKTPSPDSSQSNNKLQQHSKQPSRSINLVIDEEGHGTFTIASKGLTSTTASSSSGFFDGKFKKNPSSSNLTFDIVMDESSQRYLITSSMGLLDKIRTIHLGMNILRTLSHWNDLQKRRYEENPSEVIEGGQLKIIPHSNNWKKDKVILTLTGDYSHRKWEQDNVFQMELERFVEDALQFHLCLNSGSVQDSSIILCAKSTCTDDGISKSDHSSIATTSDEANGSSTLDKSHTECIPSLNIITKKGRNKLLDKVRQKMIH